MSVTYLGPERREPSNIQGCASMEMIELGNLYQGEPEGCRIVNSKCLQSEIDVDRRR
jgi:hypothetical protein